MLSLILTALLLIKFDWAGSFSTVDEAGVSSLNVFAVVAMIIGYVVIPVLVYFYAKKNTEKVDG